ncbi:MAG: hypothetical protein M3R25_08905 [Bacteroidota bacterium]|nr:hypothetical protein [Bacteroidota bacterium]
MQSYIFSFIVLIVYFTACAPKVTVEENTLVTDTLVADTKPKVENHTGHCYLSVIGKDSILMTVTVDNNMVTGYLHYRFSEKDKSGGKFIGTIKGDTILADYQFMAEGMESEREVTFVRRGEELIEGYGDVEERNGRVIFKDHSAIKFEGRPMKQADCATLQWYFPKK